MEFLRSRNTRLHQRYKDLALIYRKHGEPWRVRWDYAFFQMAVETNFLTYRRQDGRTGDVDPDQNNFAGIGTTGGGVPGDSYPDIETGVLAHIQHLVAYSGETVADPIAPRTQLKQEGILARSRALNRPVRFSDLAGRWAADRAYGRYIEWVAESFRNAHCAGAKGPEDAETLPWAATADAAGARHTPAVRTIWRRADAAAPGPRAATAAEKAPTRRPSPPAPATPAPVPARTTATGARPPRADVPPARFALLAPPAFPLSAPVKHDAAPAPAARRTSPAKSSFDPSHSPPSGLGVKPSACSVDAVSLGGTKTILIRSGGGRADRFTVLSVLDGLERSMTESFIKASAPGGSSLGEFPSKEAAIAKAHELCASS